MITPKNVSNNKLKLCVKVEGEGVPRNLSKGRALDASRSRGHMYQHITGTVVCTGGGRGSV